MKKVFSHLGLLFLVLVLSACSRDSSKTDTRVVEPTNNAPSIDTTFANITLEENNAATSYELDVSDADGDSLTITVESNNTDIITTTPNWTNSVVQANYDGVKLDFNLATVTDAFGVAQITITVDDGEASATTSFDVNVTEKIIIHKGLAYGRVVSPFTGKVWLDRNLGATQVCTAFNDTACYGDYYQWGRDADGHQESNSTTTATLATNVSNTGADFIRSDTNDWVDTGVDDSGSLRAASWSKTDGTSVCPVGFRVPTIGELKAETIEATTVVEGRDTAFTNFLKLPSAGYRENEAGSLIAQGSEGYIWSSSPDSEYASNLLFMDSYADLYSIYRSYGKSVRCIRD
jgi:uncharacterized protein (TIGR02145 family)